MDAADTAGYCAPALGNGHTGVVMDRCGLKAQRMFQASVHDDGTPGRVSTIVPVMVPLALSVSVALAQVGEFSFILAGIGLMYNILPPDANQAIILAAVVSISLNPILYRQIGPAVKWLQKRGIGLADPGGVNSMALPAPDARRVVLVGFGPTGRILKRILNDNGVEVIIVEMNIDTVTAIREQGGDIVYGDASQREILRHAGIEYAESLILSASIPDAKEIVGVALELNPHIDVMIHTKYMRDVDILKEAVNNARHNAVFCAVAIGINHQRQHACKGYGAAVGH